MYVSHPLQNRILIFHFYLLVSFFGDLFIDEPLPKDGYVELPHDKYGFGVTLNREGLTMTRPYPRNEAK